MAKSKSLSEKLLGLTEDRTTTVTPSFMEILAPLMSIMYFSGMSGDISKMFGGQGKGLLPSGDMMANQASAQSAADSIVGDIRGTGMGTSALTGAAPMLGPASSSSGTLTPEMIIKILSMLGGLGGGKFM